MKRRTIAILLAMTMTASVMLPANTVYATEADEIVAVQEEAAQEVEEAAPLTDEAAENTETETAVGETVDQVQKETEEVKATLEESSQPAGGAESFRADDTILEETVSAEEELLYAAQQGVTSGNCGQAGANLTWSYSGGVLTISGNGAMKDYPVYDTPGSDQCMPWYYFRNEITTIVINEGVTSIGACAFWGCNRLTSVKTPNSLKSIGFAAFADCTSISEINIPSGIIGESAFIRCSSLTKATIGSGVTAIGISAFENCHAMNAVYIHDIAAWCRIDFGGYLANPLQMAKHLYLNGALVTRLDIPHGVTEIRDYAFEYCEDLTLITMPSTLTRIGDYAFYLCTKLDTVMLHEGLTEIGASAFDSCISLKNISLPGSVSYIGSYAFTWTPITTINVQRGTIASHAFEGCGAIGEISLGADVKNIGAYAFNNCAGLRTVHYSGSQAQWNAVKIGANNGSLMSANLISTGTGTAELPIINRDGVYVGATAVFGTFEQDNNHGNGKEQIEWTVLDVKDNKALVISKYVLDFQRYYPNLQTAVTWENSDLRRWLNNDFMNNAFSAGEKAKISSTTLTNNSNKAYGTAGGVNTTDHIFILSSSEVETYFKEEESRMSRCTEYAVNRSGDPALRNQVVGTSYWWVRTPGMFTYSAMYAHYTGSLRYDGMAVANTIVGVRPAMWVEKDALTVLPSDQGGSIEKIAQFTDRLYNVCLDREPDAAGEADWIYRMASGKETGTTATFGFIFSQEFQNRNFCNEDYVKQLYRAFMGREYDEGGLSSWVGALESGTTREGVFNGFSQSAEFGNLCGEYGIAVGEGIAIPQYGTVPKGSCSVCGKVDGVTAFTTRLYNVCLDREPDAGGLTDWTGNLWEHTRSGKDVALGFIFSEEFTNRGLNNEDYVEYLYRAFFDRTADAGGKSDWLNRMNGEGYSRLDVFNGFVGSAEFDNLCKRYGITRD
ncbi:MAG: leucine-rich repeat protein [Clostridiales bacterium]|nr:leucine-rich repeat protein [Clostridiales bacterium]